MFGGRGVAGSGTNECPRFRSCALLVLAYGGTDRPHPHPHPHPCHTHIHTQLLLLKGAISLRTSCFAFHCRRFPSIPANAGKTMRMEKNGKLFNTSINPLPLRRTFYVISFGPHTIASFLLFTIVILNNFCVFFLEGNFPRKDLCLCLFFATKSCLVIGEFPQEKTFN